MPLKIIIIIIQALLGVNVFILDNGFNFRHPEFSNSKYYECKSNNMDKNDRIVQCVGEDSIYQCYNIYYIYSGIN